MPSPALLLQNLRWRLFRNSLRMLVAQSGWRMATIVFCCLIIWGFLFGLSWYGFHELKTRPGWNFPLEQNLIELPFNVFFFTLTIFLIFSASIILYSSLFGSAESQFLLASPIPDDQVFSYKFQGAVAFSSWAFVLVASPVFLAYGLEVKGGAPWYYYAILPAFFGGFLLLPGFIGALSCLAIVKLLPRHRRQLMIGLGLMVVLSLCLWGYGWAREAREFGVGSRNWFESLLREMSFLGGKLVPFQWMSRGIKAAALGRTGEMAYCLGLVWSYGLFAYLVTVWLAGKLYRRGLNRVASGGTLRRRFGGHWLDRLLTGVIFFLDSQTQTLIVKDFRAFRRDPAQWAQVLIFVGMGFSYLFFFRRYFAQRDDSSGDGLFKIIISLLTLAATSFLMCAFTGRFIFPMLSLEGNKFWILGLLPLERGRLLLGKFVFSSAGCFVIGEILIVSSNVALGMSWLIVAVHALTIGLLALGFSGLSVGLGAAMPNFRESDPSKIAVGFGGTVNLVSGLLFLGAVIGTVAAPLQFLHARQPDLAVPLDSVPWFIWGLMLVGILIGASAIWLPMCAGVRKLRAMEF